MGINLEPVQHYIKTLKYKQFKPETILEDIRSALHYYNTQLNSVDVEHLLATDFSGEKVLDVYVMVYGGQYATVCYDSPESLYEYEECYKVATLELR